MTCTTPFWPLIDRSCPSLTACLLLNHSLSVVLDLAARRFCVCTNQHKCAQFSPSHPHATSTVLHMHMHMHMHARTHTRPVACPVDLGMLQTDTSQERGWVRAPHTWHPQHQPPRASPGSLPAPATGHGAAGQQARSCLHALSGQRLPGAGTLPCRWCCSRQEAAAALHIYMHQSAPHQVCISARYHMNAC